MDPIGRIVYLHSYDVRPTRNSIMRPYSVQVGPKSREDIMNPHLKRLRDDFLTRNYIMRPYEVQVGPKSREDIMNPHLKRLRADEMNPNYRKRLHLDEGIQADRPIFQDTMDRDLDKQGDEMNPNYRKRLRLDEGIQADRPIFQDTMDRNLDKQADLRDLIDRMCLHFGIQGTQDDRPSMLPNVTIMQADRASSKDTIYLYRHLGIQADIRRLIDRMCLDFGIQDVKAGKLPDMAQGMLDHKDNIKRIYKQMGIPVRGVIPGRMSTPTQSNETTNLVFLEKGTETPTIPRELSLYPIIFRHIGSFSDEDKSIQYLQGSKPFSKEDLKQLNKFFTDEAHYMLSRHSNISAILPSPYKSTKYRETGKWALKKETCVVIYVPVKGFIPDGEETFKKRSRCGLPIDVREGIFDFFVWPKERQHKLTHGCMVSSDCVQGSLGCFVKHPDIEDRFAFITCAHAVCNPDKMASLQEKCKTGDYEYEDQNQIAVYQPDRQHEIGKVLRAIVFSPPGAHGVEAVLVEITDTERNPVGNQFPNFDWPFYITKPGFEVHRRIKTYVENQFEIEIVKEVEDIQDRSILFKCGPETAATFGKYNKALSLNCLRPDNENKYSPNQNDPRVNIYNQLAAENDCFGSTFAKTGDSGSAVFVYRETSKRLQLLGLLVGGQCDERGVPYRYFIMPMVTILRRLSLSDTVSVTGIKNDIEHEFLLRNAPQIRNQIGAQTHS